MLKRRGRNKAWAAGVCCVLENPARHPTDYGETTMRKLVAVAVIAAAISIPIAAGAAEPNDDFGPHVRACVQQHGLDSSHNPGMHKGAAGWDGSIC